MATVNASFSRVYSRSLAVSCRFNRMSRRLNSSNVFFIGAVSSTGLLSATCTVSVLMAVVSLFLLDWNSQERRPFFLRGLITTAVSIIMESLFVFRLVSMESTSDKTFSITSGISTVVRLSLMS